MYCGNCGKELPEGAASCPACGARTGLPAMGAGECLNNNAETAEESAPADDTSCADAPEAGCPADEDAAAFEAAVDSLDSLDSLDAEVGLASEEAPEDDAADVVPEVDRTIVRPLVIEETGPEPEPSRPVGSNVGNAAIRTTRTRAKERPKESVERATPKKSHGTLIIVIALVAAVVAVTAVIWYTYDQEMWGGKTVPMVVSLATEDARAQLEDKGFQVDVEEQAVDEGVGTVLQEDPDGQSRLPEGSTVRLVVGVARVMPAVVGRAGTDAAQTLTDAGLVVTTQEVLSDEAEGTVLASTLPEGSTFKTGDAVTLTVAKARVVPEVVGMGKSDATAAIEAQGLTAQVTYQEADSGIGTVLAVSPEAGTTATADTTVTLTVAKQRGVTVPNIIGMNYTWAGQADEATDNAKAALEAMGLKFQKVSVPPDGEHGLGEVIWQYPVAGTVVAPGSTVQVYEISQ